MLQAAAGSAAAASEDSARPEGSTCLTNSARGRPADPQPGAEAVAEKIRQYWCRYAERLCARLGRNQQVPPPATPLSHLLATLHTLRDIASSLYGTRVDGVVVPETDLKVYLGDVVVATTLGVFSAGGVSVVPTIKATQTRARHVLCRATKDALAMLAANAGGGGASPDVVLFVADDRHVHRPAGQHRASKGAGRARRGAGLVVSASGSAALVAALDLALEGVGRAAVR